MQKFHEYVGARLLSAAEWVQILASVPNVPVEQTKAWWLNRECEDKDTFFPNNGSFCVKRNGEVGFAYTEQALLGIRPALEIFGFGGHPGSKIQIGSCVCTVISEESDHGFTVTWALPDNIIWFREMTDMDKFLQSSTMRSVIFGPKEAV